MNADAALCHGQTNKTIQAYCYHLGKSHLPYVVHVYITKTYFTASLHTRGRMAANSAGLQVSFEDMKISFDRENSGEQLTQKSENEKHTKSAKNKNILPYVPKDSVKKFSPLDTPQLMITEDSENTGRSKNYRIEKLGKTVKKDAASFVSRLRANTWSPKQSKAPEFDSINLIHKMSEELEDNLGDRRSSHKLNCIELIYQPGPSDERLSSKRMDKIPRPEDKNPGIPDQSDGYDANGNNDNPRSKDPSPGYQDSNFELESPVRGQEYLNCTPRDDVSGSTLENARRKNINNNTYEARKPRLPDSKLEDLSSKYDDRNRRLEEPRHRADTIPGFRHPELPDSRFVDRRRDSDVSLKNGAISSGRVFLPLKNDGQNKLRNTLLPNCINRRGTTSNESLPRVPLGKVSLVQAGVWHRLRDDDSPKGRNRSFTR